MNCPSCQLGSVEGERGGRYCADCRINIPDYVIDLCVDNQELKQSVKTLTKYHKEKVIEHPPCKNCGVRHHEDNLCLYEDLIKMISILNEHLKNKTRQFEKARDKASRLEFPDTTGS